MSQHCRANPCCGDRPCSGIPLPQHASGLTWHNKKPKPEATEGGTWDGMSVEALIDQYAHGAYIGQISNPPVSVYREHFKEFAEKLSTLQADERSCTCHPDDNPPIPCARKFAYSECETEGGAHEKGLISPRAGSFGVDWHEQWLKMRKSYHALKHAATRVVAETDRIHDNEPWPLKYRAPYEAITVLRAALTAKQADGREGE